MLVGSTAADHMHLRTGVQEKSFFDDMLLKLGPSSTTRDAAESRMLRELIQQRFPILYQLMVEAHATPCLGGPLPGGLYIPAYLQVYVGRLAAIYAKYRATVIEHRISSDADASASEQAASREADNAAQATELDQQQLARVGTLGVRHQVSVQQLWAQGAWFHPSHR